MAFLIAITAVRKLFKRFQAVRARQYLPDEEAQDLGIRFSSFDLFTGETSESESATLFFQPTPRQEYNVAESGIEIDELGWYRRSALADTYVNMHAHWVRKSNVPMSTSCMLVLSFPVQIVRLDLGLYATSWSPAIRPNIELVSHCIFILHHLTNDSGWLCLRNTSTVLLTPFLTLDQFIRMTTFTCGLSWILQLVARDKGVSLLLCTLVNAGEIGEF